MFRAYRYDETRRIHVLDLTVVDEWDLKSGSKISLDKKGRWELPQLIEYEANLSLELLHESRTDDGDAFEGPLVRLVHCDEDISLNRFFTISSLEPFVIESPAVDPMTEEESEARPSRSQRKEIARRAEAEAERCVGWRKDETPLNLRIYVLHEPSQSEEHKLVGMHTAHHSGARYDASHRGKKSMRDPLSAAKRGDLW